MAITTEDKYFELDKSIAESEAESGVRTWQSVLDEFCERSYQEGFAHGARASQELQSMVRESNEQHTAG